VHNVQFARHDPVGELGHSCGPRGHAWVHVTGTSSGCRSRQARLWRRLRGPSDPGPNPGGNSGAGRYRNRRNRREAHFLLVTWPLRSIRRQVSGSCFGLGLKRAWRSAEGQHFVMVPGCCGCRTEECGSRRFVDKAWMPWGNAFRSRLPNRLVLFFLRCGRSDVGSAGECFSCRCYEGDGHSCRR